MGAKTKIDWCDATWNPVTGCLHGCEYCYARGIANRFGLPYAPKLGDPGMEGALKYDSGEGLNTMLELAKPFEKYGRKQPYPMGFLPTFHRYKLDEPQHWKKPRTIFVCSMADLFGDWVPDEWIKDVLAACRRAPQHRYLFLTKNPMRYDALEDVGIITPEDDNFWLGSTTTDINKDLMHYASGQHTFQSCEPMLAPWPEAREPNQESAANGWLPEWVIFGAETGNRKDKVVPEKGWIDNAVQMCRNMGAAVFMKESLRGIMGADFVQEFPWKRDPMSKKPTPDELLIAIHKHCLEYSGGSRKELHNCRIKGCNLYPYRQEPTRIWEKPSKGQITLFDLVQEGGIAANG